MRAARYCLCALALLSVLIATSAAAAPPGTPTGLRGFDLRPNEPPTRTFSRTPAFAWNPVRGAACYEFELATSQTFSGSSIVWSNVSTDAKSGKHCRPVKVSFPKVKEPGTGGSTTSGPELVRETIAPIRIPAVSVNLTLPWFTGKLGYALYAHVRSVTTQGASAWSRPYGFDMRWEDTPVPQPARPGLVRWTPIDGATGYEVWFGGQGPKGYINKIVQTHTNVADQRDLYTFHLDDGWWRTVQWRVRAMRSVVGALPNGLPAVSYGPWTAVYATTNPAWSSGRIRLGAAVSDRVSTGMEPPHELMPAVTWTGDQALDGYEARLFRVYAFTDKDCVNVVFKGSVVGSPAFAPRVNGPLKLPKGQTDLDFALTGILPNWENENAKTFTADTYPLVANEAFDQTRTMLRIDLPDLDTRTTRYFWTVVPVVIVVNEETGEFEYWDYESPQDACQAGRVGVFGRDSKPAQTAGGSPYVSGLTPAGRLLSQAGSRPTVFASPLVAWRPAVGATEYEIQWSRTTYPWRKRGAVRTVATSAVLRLPAGVWYYRVRGLNPAQIGTPAMTWSAPVAVKVVQPTFRISG
ncbi:MAG TPA: hypothetical protein VFU99_03410 [Gaiellaceae bacterium]|nr:hypothetical protein [Gaiellaceae bacterium]